jgi:hypothetical protein
MKRRQFLLGPMAAAGWSLLSCSRDNNGAASAAPPSDAAPPAGRNKWALLIGIDKYEYPDRVSPLDGCVNDVQSLKTLLIGKYEFPVSNIRTLTNQQATHAGIVEAFKSHLVANAKPNDIVVFHYSGHGSQMKDVTGKMISGLDETIVPHDSRDPLGKVFDISGAELHGLLVQLAAKTHNITFILDSCHSGTLVRGNRVRTVAPDTRTPPPLQLDGATARGLYQSQSPGADKPPYAFIAATTSRESAFEHYADGQEHGALSYFLVRQLRTAGPSATYRDTMDSVIGNVNANYPSQHPQLEGIQADQYVFGDSTGAAQTYILASGDTGGRVSFSAGQAQGLTLGSIFDVYRPGVKKFDGSDKPIARVQLTDVQGFSATGKLLSGGPVPQASRAVEREHKYGSLRMRVFLDGVDQSAALQAISAALQPFRYVEVVNDPRICNMQVRQNGNRLLTVGADEKTLSPPVSVSDPRATSRVVEQIKKWAQWFNVLSIHNVQPGWSVEFTIKASQGGVTRDPMQRLGKPDAALTAGDRIDASVKNNSGRDLYLSILDLSSDGSISVVYPEDRGKSAVLTAGSTFSTTFEAFVPPGRSTVNDVLKVFASTKPIDLAPLSQARIRGEADPIGELLEDASGVERGVKPLESSAARLGDWSTAQRLITVRKKALN